MKKLLILISLAFQIGICSAQIKFFDYSWNSTDIIQMHDGKLLVLTNDKLYKLGADLSTIWESEYLEVFDYSPSKIFEEPDGSVTVFNNSAMVRLTGTGEIINTYDLSIYHLAAVGRYGHVYKGIGIEWIDPENTIYHQYKINLDGSIEWDNTVNISNLDYSPFIFADGDTTTIITTKYNFLLDFDSVFVTQIDTLGNILNTANSATTSGSWSISKIKSGFILKCRNFGLHNTSIQKRNADWEEEWTTLYSLDLNTWEYDSLPPILEMPGDNLLWGRVLQNELSETFCLQLEYLSAEGEPMFTGPKFLETNYFDDGYYALKIIRYDENHLAHLGSYYSAGNPTRAFVLLTDTLGNVPNLTMNGKIYFDENDNEEYDTGEIQFKNVFIESSPLEFYSLTNDAGNYSMNLFTEGTYTNTPVAPLYWDICDPTSYTAELNYATSGDTINNLDYRLDYSVHVTDASVSIYNYFSFWGGWENLIILNNFGNQTIESGTVSLDLPSLSVLDSVSPPYISIDDTIITWEFSDLDPFETIYISYYSHVPYDTILVGSVLSATAFLNDIPGDIDPSDNMVTDSNELEYAYDPNHKMANPAGIGENGTTDPDTKLITYSIEFQNTGTAPAVNISVADTIDTDFDFTSFQMLGASHQYYIEIVMPNIIIWHFDNIYLPDSSEDLSGSTGFIQYRIHLNEDAGLGTRLTNSAAIYFDLNDPVITNTTLNTLEEQTGSIEEEIINNMFSIYPNPVNEELTIELLNPANKFLKAELFNLNGTKLKTIQINSGTNTVHLSTKVLSPGIYFIRIIDIENGNTDQHPFIRN